ncbi:MAG TPA: MocE family 2Fe-2S type ferredoxin [Steroidobacteraceae bacterium]|jgi:3-phenylpropionate/trans-cinnamate dioxygenase ferredoxin subunit|nr:MocE family 2Fe-2S type ferredoxin [Steroidobacteraceae bacterium]
MNAMTSIPWIAACSADDIAPEDVIRFDHDGRCFALYRTADGRYFATDGLCTHEQAALTDGLVTGTVIECPKHNGRFDFTTGKAIRRPACIDLKTYAVKLDAGTVFVRIE